VAERQRAEPFGERYLPLVIEVLVAQEDDFVVQQGLADGGDLIVGQRPPVSAPVTSAPMWPASRRTPIAVVVMVAVMLFLSVVMAG
jgi:hypothetical protein